MSKFENGQRIGLSWGVVDGEVQRVCFVVNNVHPDGYLLGSNLAFEPALQKTIYLPNKIPVTVVFVDTPKVASNGSITDDGHIEYEQINPPLLDAIPLLWEDFEPTEDYLPPLP